MVWWTLPHQYSDVEFIQPVWTTARRRFRPRAAAAAPRPPTLTPPPRPRATMIMICGIPRRRDGIFRIFMLNSLVNHQYNSLPRILIFSSQRVLKWLVPVEWQWHFAAFFGPAAEQ
jgi:hypothetical protein